MMLMDAPITFGEPTSALSQGIIGAMFLFFLAGLLRGWWVLGRELKAESDRANREAGRADKWEQLYNQSQATNVMLVSAIARPSPQEGPPG